ncbi:DUF2262 domain-containing protein [Bacillus aquiflavi]|uniref:DUF2262 domain-containing protein n=1 Tax=Bacillus aquiflavi TaxID=2672567 RepID=A0A6B3VU92_9BACI|nr:DUF2262 domain-containing protein [Bacillus aquiflavi]MBA4537302.1 DUF2262 domain-containing protein [Bacillus aquiflavi]NEY81559.1 DUF2262 domain-containing protein [Bacillus aquiflavi]UAC47132.1 DUF2262 domain-containing protein [Bacillus aquiflavi]
MSELNEISRFEQKFTEEVIEVAAVIGASGVGAGRAGGDLLWHVSIPLIAWENLNRHEPVMKEELRLQWLADDKEFERKRDLLKANSVVRLQVRRGENSMMLVKVLETSYRDNELEEILQESLKPVYYHDEVLGQFELIKSVKIFERKISWTGEEGCLTFDWYEDHDKMKSALETAYALFKQEDEWSQKMKEYAAEELVELANDWLQDDEEAEFDEITKEIFIESMKLSTICVYPEGDFEVYYSDGDMFYGHSIIVCGNINGEFEAAEIAG